MGVGEAVREDIREGLLGCRKQGDRLMDKKRKDREKTDTDIRMNEPFRK